jgi:hypothetical protein
MTFSGLSCVALIACLVIVDEEILINQKDVPDLVVGDVVEIYHIEDVER